MSVAEVTDIDCLFCSNQSSSMWNDETMKDEYPWKKKINRGNFLWCSYINTCSIEKNFNKVDMLFTLLLLF